MSWMWTEDNTAALVRLWGQGLSAGQVAKSLNRAVADPVSRSAVLGKLHRLGLLQRRTAARPRGSLAYLPPAKPVRLGSGRPRLNPIPPPEPFKPSAVVVDSPDPLGFLDMPDHSRCRWPLDGEPFRFCGNRSGRGVYCEGHHAIAYDAEKTKEAHQQAELAVKSAGSR